LLNLVELLEHFWKIFLENLNFQTPKLFGTTIMYVCPYPKTYLGGVMYHYNAIWQSSNKMEKQKLINSQTGSTFETAAVSHIIQPFCCGTFSHKS
jgi:hypothetical protein